MASIGEVYGNDFSAKATRDKALYEAKLFGNNIANKVYSFRNDSNDMWSGPNMKPDVVSFLVQHVKAVNPMMRLLHVKKTSKDINRFKYFVTGPVEYFNVIDLGSGQTVCIYITPTTMEAQ